MKTLTCLSAWLGLLPLPLDQALRAPLKNNKSSYFKEMGKGHQSLFQAFR